MTEADEKRLAEIEARAKRVIGWLEGSATIRADRAGPDHDPQSRIEWAYADTVRELFAQLRAAWAQRAAVRVKEREQTIDEVADILEDAIGNGVIVELVLVLKRRQPARLTSAPRLANIREALARCDQCDNGIEQAWNYCARCGHQLVEGKP